MKALNASRMRIQLRTNDLCNVLEPQMLTLFKGSQFSILFDMINMQPTEHINRVRPSQVRVV